MDMLRVRSGWLAASQRFLVRAYLPLALLLALPLQPVKAEESPSADTYSVGIATVDITPDHPIRLSGFGGRRTESEGVRQHLYAKALAIGTERGSPAVLITVDSLAISDEQIQEVAGRLKREAGVDPERVAIAISHSHTTPMLTGVCPTLFSVPIPPEHQAHIDQYTQALLDNLVKVGTAAVKDLQPSRLEWGLGKVGFAINRRTAGGPVDHDLPVLVVRNPEGKLRAIHTNYACHCVTLSDNKVSGDWAGYAQEHIERQHPGVVALVSIGCGADSNPRSGVTGDKADIASQQGVEIATEVERILQGPLHPVTGSLTIEYTRIDLPFDTHPTREQFAERAKKDDAVGYHAKVQLAKLDRGEKLRTAVSYPIESWKFGKSLAWVFLPGEVVVDYALRLKKELDGQRLWTVAYSNASPGYVPSERILREGGYEGGGAMVYYDQPTRFAAGLEQPIVDTVKQQLGDGFAPGPKVGATALSPQQSLAALRPRAGMTADLIAAEPLVASPVAIDFGPDGKLWVAEMYDYPLGLDGQYKPGGRVRLLEATKGDGRFDKSTVFLEGIPFPTGVTVWRDGVLVCAAPDILFAQDTDNDGKADVVRKLYSGFGTDNYQARVNSLEYGLDGWVYGSCGLFGGNIARFHGDPVPLGDRDFRIHPDTGDIEAATGRTQQGRVRDDWGNWFACDNGTLIRHYPLADHYLRRNPYVVPPAPSVYLPSGPNAGKLFPPKSGLQMFKLSGPVGVATAACGVGIYRDELLGEAFRGNSFTCEPVNLLVHRERISPKGSTFTSTRSDDEAESEFLVSSDPWFRPVQVRTGPDGALYVVDMHRAVIEHPRWIPPEDVAQLDVRAGFDMGRIYRIHPKEHAPRAWPRLDQMKGDELVAALDSPNGWQRDMAMQLILWRRDRMAAKGLLKLAQSSPRPETRLEALCTLASLNELPVEAVRAALKDSHAGVRRHAVRLAEPFLAKIPAVGIDLASMQQDPDAQVKLQLAYSLGEWHDPRGARALAAMAKDSTDPYLIAASLSSLRKDNIDDVTTATFESLPKNREPGPFVPQLIGVAAGLADEKALIKLAAQVATPRAEGYAAWQWAALRRVLEAFDRRGMTLATLEPGKNEAPLPRMLREARAIAVDRDRPEAARLPAISLLGRDVSTRETDLENLRELLSPQQSQAIQQAAISALGTIDDRRTPQALLASWNGLSPALKALALDTLLSRDAWMLELLAQIESEEFPARNLDATRRQRLLTHKRNEVRTLAKRLFTGGGTASRVEVLAAHRDVADLKGDAPHGKSVFSRVCANCHRLDAVGHDVGPNLAALANKSPQALLQEILDPNRNVDSRYTVYTAVTSAGRSFSGLLANETSTTITLVGAEAKAETLLRADLDELQSSGQSLMPEGLEKDLSKQDFADLLTYLMTTSVEPKSIPGNVPALVQLQQGRLPLLATKAAIFGDAIVFEEPFRNIGFWHGLRDHIAWTVEVPEGSKGEFDVWFDWACDNASAGNTFALDGGEPALHGSIEPTGGWDHYVQQKVGEIRLAPGKHRLVLRPDGATLQGALMDLRGVHLVPPGEAPILAAVNEPAAIDEKDPASIAKAILDDARPAAEREQLARKHFSKASQLVSAMTADLKAGTPEEYRRIPWIWRVAIAAGKDNDTKILRDLLETSLPAADGPLLDWQSVVVGGGIINGISQLGTWPEPRLAEILAEDKPLSARWKHTLAEAAKMVDNEKTPTGTRYDALRIIPLSGWEASRGQLTKYLAKGTHAELQMGSVSGLADVDHPEVIVRLLKALEYLTDENARLAVDALLRNDERTESLLAGIDKRLVKASQLNDAQRQALLKHKNEKLRDQARKLLEK